MSILGISFKFYLWSPFGLGFGFERVSSRMQLQPDQSSSQTDNIFEKEKLIIRKTSKKEDIQKIMKCHDSALDGSSASTLRQGHDGETEKGGSCDFIQ